MFYRLKSRLVQFRGAYPAQFWLMFWGMLISTIGSSMVWPFLMIFATKEVGLNMTAAGSLLTIQSAVTLASAFFAGPVIDRAGRKWMMVISLLGIAGVYLFYTRAETYGVLAVLMALTGFFNPLYRVGADAMMADLIPPEQRHSGYALLRMANNLGISIGPMIGGIAAAISYNIAFIGAATGMSAYAVLIALFARETLASKTAAAGAQKTALPPAAAASERTASERTDSSERFAGYAQVFADKPFLGFIVAFTLTQLCAALIWILLGVHAQRNFGVGEDQYGLIPATNAIMVVVFQAFVSMLTRRRQPLRVLALGSLLYAVAVTSVAFGSSFGHFWLSMVIMTVGELMLMPTSTTYTANLAPAHMRGRYMSVYSLTWGIAQGVGSLGGGFLADTLGPSAPWIGGGVAGALAVTAFVVLAGRAKTAQASGYNTLNG